MKKLTMLFFAVALSSMAQAQSVTKVYHFHNPTVSNRNGYQQVSLEGCLPTGQVGEPTLPWQNISLILPQGQKAVSMQVELSDFVEMEGHYDLYPYQKPRPYSSDDDIPFAKNESLYRSSAPYPAQCHGAVSTQYLNGVAFAFGGFTPVRYVPATGKVSYARTVTVSIETTASRDDHSSKLWLTPENEASLKRLAQNEDMLGSYSKRGREIGGYDMLVITAEEWIPSFSDYLNLYNGKGIRTQIVSLESIYASTSGRDEQEKIRNYIIQEYENNGIMTVCLGGDVAIVPYRSLWCWAQDDEEDQLPSDMYYACLDGTLNDDNDDKWGEVGEDDLLPEIGIGRLPFNNEAQFEAVMHKTLSYLQNPILGEFTSPILGAEHLGDGYYGSEDMERLVGINTDFGYTTQGYPTDYNFKRYYATPTKDWSAYEFRMLIGTGGQYVHHLGHANTGTVAGWEITDMSNNTFARNNGVDHNYMIFHSHGCICGDFSHSCILERMVTITTGFVATTGNSRYGWYVPWGDGMAAHIHREFIDAYCNDHIDMLGMALREAKIATAPWVTADGENGCLRWNLYCLNAIGDAALCPWFEEPFHPNVTYEQGLVVGTTSTQVHVSHFDTPLDNFRVSLFDGDDLIARGITDANGDATLIFETPLQTVGEMQLIVTGQSAWPQTLEVVGFESGTPFIYGDILHLEGEALSGTQFLSVSGDLFNKGNMTAHNVHAAVTSDSEYILSHGSNFTIDEFEPNSTMHFDNIGLIDIAPNIPDQTTFTLSLTTYVGDVTHTTHKSFYTQAPNMRFTGIVVDDSMGDDNGYPDPGEQVTLRINGDNHGHATAHDAYLTVICSDSRVHIAENTLPIGEIEPSQAFSTDLNFYTDGDMTSGTIVHFNMVLHYGEYTLSNDHILTIGTVLETFESADFNFLEWEHGGVTPWFITSEEAHDGTYCAQAGQVERNQTSELRINADVLTDAEISFFFKTSTVYHKDYLAFYIDGVMQDFWSGDIDWTQVSFSIPSGSHEFMWLYKKKTTSATGSSNVWIDDITFPRASIITQTAEPATPAQASLYPNPCRGSFNVELVKESCIDIFNLQGQLVTHLDKASGRMQLQLNNPGLYLVRISNESGVETLKLIAE